MRAAARVQIVCHIYVGLKKVMGGGEERGEGREAREGRGEKEKGERARREVITVATRIHHRSVSTRQYEHSRKDICYSAPPPWPLRPQHLDESIYPFALCHA